jgi:hypothetical protein
MVVEAETRENVMLMVRWDANEVIVGAAEGLG